jgi:hypothetical protein
MIQPQPDGNLPEARRELSNAISALTDPKPTLAGSRDCPKCHNEQCDPDCREHECPGHVEWVDSLYVQLRKAIPGEKRHRTGVSASQPPMWIGALDQLRKIDSTVTSWEPHWPLQLPSLWPFAYDDEYPTIQRLRILEKRRWRPQDCALIDERTEKILGWCDKITELLNETPKLSLPNACPACNTKVVHRPDPDGGPPLRSAALQIGALGCTCAHCRYTWSPQHYVHLAAVLGYQLPEGVLT